jgi:hypothetical protein
MNTSNTHRFASLAFAAIVTIAMLLGVNQLAASTSTSTSTSTPTSGQHLATAAVSSQT